jgi:hypothetical protein
MLGAVPDIHDHRSGCDCYWLACVLWLRSAAAAATVTAGDTDQLVCGSLIPASPLLLLSCRYLRTYYTIVTILILLN